MTPRKDTGDLERRMENIETLFPRVRALELLAAEAKGTRIGVVMTVSFFWAIAIAGVTAAWRFITQ